jgi:glutaredoxin 3
MAQIEIYTTKVCPYCVRAKRLFDRKGVSYAEIDVTTDEVTRRLMIERAGGRRTVPQIFIDGTHVGGCDELYELDRDGRLDPLLAGAA